MSFTEHCHMEFYINQLKLIEEVKKRPALYSTERKIDRTERLAAWREVGTTFFSDWDECSKATAYDRVLQLQRKWRSLRDAYNRELRARRSGVRVNKAVYRYFKNLSFLGGFEGGIDDEDELESIAPDNSNETCFNDPLVSSAGSTSTPRPKRPRKRSIKKSPSTDSEDNDNGNNEELEVPVYSLDVSETDTDSDKLFLLSFLPELRQLPINVKMWARAQIASVMQEAINSQYNNTMPKTMSFKSQRHNSSD